MSGDFTRFVHALKDVQLDKKKRLRWFADPTASGAIERCNIYAGDRPVGTAHSPEIAELMVSAGNYMLELCNQIGSEPDYRDDLLKRAAMVLEHDPLLQGEILGHLNHLYPEVKASD